MVHFRSNTLLKTILNTFCTLIECEAEVKINGAFMALANFKACFDVSSCSSGEQVVKASYLVPTKNGNAFYDIHQTYEYVVLYEFEIPYSIRGLVDTIL